MCGIAGFIDYQASAEPERRLRRMAAALAHRGPDGEGIWFDAATGVGLVHRRLAIIDLSEEGRQPMQSAGGRYWISFNGEVYNFAELRRELEPLGYRFRGHSDTEIMLAAIETWGLQAAVGRFIGMFAFALWDRFEQCLYLVRDRLGIKPLYYGYSGGRFVFGSELKALRAGLDSTPAIDRNALTLLVRHNYIPAPYSIWQDIHKLPPGWILRLARAATVPQIDPYWSAAAVAEAGLAEPFTGSDDEMVERLDSLLRAAVGARMVADVPVGAFLSGGIDSSTVAALMQALSDRPIKTFTIGFPESGYNEAEHARAVARHLGTEHTELYVQPADALAVIPRLPILYDEPFADSSQIPTFLISELTRRHVTVSLSGDGGDELFCGYNRYVWGQRLWQRLNYLPTPVRRLTAEMVRSLSPAAWERIASPVQAVLPQRYRIQGVGDKAHKLAEILALDTLDESYRWLVSHQKDPLEVVFDAHEPLTALTDPTRQAQISDPVQRMMYWDLISYLPDDILTKVDRASMGVALEARVPLLDHRVVAFAWQLPQTLKYRAGQGKWALRQVLYRYVPQALVERPKMGFGVPLDSWLRGPLRDWAETLLDERRMHEQGFFRAQVVQAQWREHLSGRRNLSYHLWDLLMFQAWWDAQGETVSSAPDPAPVELA